MRWYPYTTRARHIAYGEPTLPGLRVFEIGTPCLAARRHDYWVILTFDDLSILLDEKWYLEDIEDPNLIPSRWVREIHAIEDALFLKVIEEAIEALEQEKQLGRT